MKRSHARPTQSRRARSVAMAMLALLSVVVLSAAPAGPAAATTPGPCTPTGGLVVCGSLRQIHVFGGPSGVSVTVVDDGAPPNPVATGTTDAQGAFVLRDVDPGEYTVTVGEVEKPAIVFDETETEPPVDVAGQTLLIGNWFMAVRDGTLLSYRVEEPPNRDCQLDPCDVIITYSGYRPGMESATDPADPQLAQWEEDPFDYFTAEGYAVVGVNMRGTGCSGGAFDAMEDLVGWDGYDVVEAFAAQSWVDQVALADRSWPGLSQLHVAAKQPPSLAAIVPGMVVGDLYRDVAHPGGVPNVGFAQAWSAGRDGTNAYDTTDPLVTHYVQAGGYYGVICAANRALRGQNRDTSDSFLSQYVDDPTFWDQWRAAVEDITAPTLLLEMWQDEKTGSRPTVLLDRFTNPALPEVRLVGANNGHASYYTEDVFAEVLAFLDHWMGGPKDAVPAPEAPSGPPVKLLIETDGVTGQAAAEVSLDALAVGGETFEMGEGAALTPEHESAPGRSTYHYDPSAYAGPDISELLWGLPLQDQAGFIQAEPFAEDTFMAGSGWATLWVEIDESALADDVDLQVSLTEIRPDGREQLVQSGWLRASRAGLTDQLAGPGQLAERPHHDHEDPGSWEPLEPGTPRMVRVEIFPFAHLFRAGSRVRLTVDGPGGMGNRWPWDFDTLPGGFDVHLVHDANHPSSLELPVVEVEGLAVPDEPLPCTNMHQPCRYPLTVTTTVDGVDAVPGDAVCEMTAGSGDCSLRAAVQEANALPGANLIELGDATYTLTEAGADDTGDAGDLDILDLTVLHGDGAVIDADGIDRVLDVHQRGELRVEGVSLTGGDAAGDGGAIRSEGPVTVLGAFVAGNEATGDGGAISAEGPLTIEHAYLHSNIAGGAGGAVAAAGTSRIVSTVMLYNQAADGAALRSAGEVELEWSTIVSNAASAGAVGISVGGTGSVTVYATILGNAFGGTLCAGDVSSLGYSVAQDASCGLAEPTDLGGTDPKVDLYGGLLATSPAVDTGPAGCPSTPSAPRPLGPACDRGAVERST